MSPGSGKTALGVAILILVWIGTYWAWEPRQRTAISLPSAAGLGAAGPDSSDGDPKVAVREPVSVEPDVPVLTQGRPAAPTAGTVSANPTARSSATGAKEPSKPARREPAVIPPVMTDYVIQKGDTLGSISRRFYGTPNHASAIARANPFMSASKLKPGRTIQIPKDPDNIQGKPNPNFQPPVRPSGTPSGQAATDGPKSTADRPVVGAPIKPAAAGVGQEYTVRPGDTLSAISKRVYGESKHANLIFEANRATLASPDSLKVGQKLTIPAKPE